MIFLQAIWYAFFAQPAPAIGLLDFYLFGPLAIVLEKKWSVEQLTLRDRMGGGNFGQVYEGVINPPGGVECTSTAHGEMPERIDVDA